MFPGPTTEAEPLWLARSRQEQGKNRIMHYVSAVNRKMVPGMWFWRWENNTTQLPRSVPRPEKAPNMMRACWEPIPITRSVWTSLAVWKTIWRSRRVPSRSLTSYLDGAMGPALPSDAVPEEILESLP